MLPQGSIAYLQRTKHALLQESEEKEDCAPNTITYSSLISACERGGQFDRALQWFERMQASGVEADAITFRYVPTQQLASPLWSKWRAGLSVLISCELSPSGGCLAALQDAVLLNSKPKDAAARC